MPRAQQLFETPPEFPEGFSYTKEFISPEEERALLAEIKNLPFEQVVFQGYLAKRRTLDYGYEYSFETGRISPGRAIPDFLLGLRARIADFAAVRPEDMSQALVTEYSPGAAIGWHRDVLPFEIVAGVSLLGECVFRLRRGEERNAGRVSVIAEPRSLYVMRGPARWEWQHSIPPTRELRYSITFRTLRGPLVKAPRDPGFGLS